VTIERAGSARAEEVTAILSEGFMDDPVCAHLFPDDAERERQHRIFFGPFVDMTLEEGEIYVTEDGAAASLWLPVDVASHAEQPDLRKLYEPLLGGECAEKIKEIDDRSTANHPLDRNHYYLTFIVVRPGHHGTGVGTALLRDRLAWLDEQHMPAYLEASSTRSTPLYARHGFVRTDTTTVLPKGPSLYPMWREAA
jgi:GNAT superfamily N-acetyltransferase